MTSIYLGRLIEALLAPTMERVLLVTRLLSKEDRGLAMMETVKVKGLVDDKGISFPQATEWVEPMGEKEKRALRFSNKLAARKAGKEYHRSHHSSDDVSNRHPGIGHPKEFEPRKTRHIDPEATMIEYTEPVVVDEWPCWDQWGDSPAPNSLSWKDVRNEYEWSEYSYDYESAEGARAEIKMYIEDIKDILTQLSSVRAIYYRLDKSYDILVGADLKDVAYNHLRESRVVSKRNIERLEKELAHAKKMLLMREQDLEDILGKGRTMYNSFVPVEMAAYFPVSLLA